MFLIFIKKKKITIKIKPLLLSMKLLIIKRHL